jgi:hypothetical protein
MKRRELFAGAAALAASPLFSPAPVAASRVLPIVTFTVQLAGRGTPVPSELIARMIAERLEHWQAQGLLDRHLEDIVIRGTVCV